MDTKLLKQKILDLAIHGKLVPQNPNDEPASKLLEKIREEKQKLIAEKKIKADKNDSYIFVGDDNRHYEQFADGTVKDIEDEIPFEVPEGWAWCRLSEIAELKGGKRIPAGMSATKDKTNHIYIRVSDMKNDTISTDDLRYISDTIFKQIQQYIIGKDDLYLTIAGTIGRVGEVPELFDKMNLTENALKITNIKINKRYLLILLKSPFVQDYFESTYHQVAMPKLSLTNASKTLLPIPPMDTQKLIVEKYFSFNEKIDCLDSDKETLEQAIKQAKSKILDLAIHGKLVPQDSSDEPASVLLEKLRAEKEARIKAGELKRDKNDSYIYKNTTDNCYYEKFADGTEEQVELPYDLPESWSWIKIKDVISYIGDGDWIESKDQSDNGIRLIQTGNIGFGNFRDKEGKYHYITEETFDKLCCNEIFPGDILISRLPEPVGRACIIPNLSQRLITAVDCTIIRLNEKIIIQEYFVYYTQSSKYLGFIKDNCTGTTRLRISRANLEKIYIPLPSLPEQQRILNKIESLFTKLDEIVLNLV